MILSKEIYLSMVKVFATINGVVKRPLWFAGELNWGGFSAKILWCFFIKF